MSTKNENNQYKGDMMDRRKFIISTGGAITSLTLFGVDAFAALPKLRKKSKYKIGFAQTESNNPWRLAQTKSMRDTAAEYGWDLVYTDAAGSAAKQVSDVRSMIAQKVDVILLAPREEKPLAVAVKEAKRANIPVFLIDRNVLCTEWTLYNSCDFNLRPSFGHSAIIICIYISLIKFTGNFSFSCFVFTTWFAL